MLGLIVSKINANAMYSDVSMSKWIIFSVYSTARQGVLVERSLGNRVSAYHI